MVATTALCGWPFLSLLPALSKDTLHAQEHGYSMMVSATGLGALTAALMIASFGSLSRRRWFIGMGVAIVSLSMLALSRVQHLPFAVLFCAFIGLGLILFFATSQAVVQLSVSDEQRGRVMGIWAMILNGAAPLGNLIVGPAADYWGESYVLGLEGLTCGLTAVGLLALYGLWHVTQTSSSD
jgi:MFS family permease